MTTPLILTITPRGKPGIYIGKIEGTGLSVRATRHPLVDCARALLLVGVSPETVLIMRNSGSSIDRVRGTVGTILRKVSKKSPRADITPFRDRWPGSDGPRGGPYVRKSGEVDG